MLSDTKRPKRLFSVTFEIVTPESAEHGDAESRGHIVAGVSLREAVQCVGETESPHCSRECIECDELPVTAPHWITVYNSPDYLTGASESRSLHIPEGVTAASRVRIARLMRAYGS